MDAPTTPLAALAVELRAAKNTEAAAREARIAVEERILAHFQAPDSGEGSAAEGDLRVEWKLTRKADTVALQDDWMELMPEVQTAFKWKADVDLRQLRALEGDARTTAAKYFTTTPAKPAITLKESA